MRTRQGSNPTSYAAAELERDLKAAQMDKALAQVPAIRRLRFVTRVFFVLGVLGSLWYIPALGAALQTTWTAAQLQESNLDFVGFIVLTGILYVANGFQVFLLILYWRFGKQLRRDHVEQLAETATAIERTWRWALSVAALGFPVTIFSQRAQLALTIGSNVFGLVFMVILFLVMRRYVRTALKELPQLITAAGAVRPKGDYATFKNSLRVSFVIAMVMMLLGYLMIGALPELPTY